MRDWKQMVMEYQVHSARADRVTKAILNRARAACKAAGLDPNLLGIHPHNAMCDFRAGKPWPNVNYSLVRKTLWLIEKSYQPHRLVSAWYSRCAPTGWTEVEGE